MSGVAEDYMSELAALYVLGALGERAEAEYEAHLTFCNDCRREVESLDAVANALAFAAPEADAPTGTRAKLEAFLRDEARELAPADAPAKQDTDAPKLTVRAGEGEWRALVNGVSVKRLFVDRARGTVTSLFRLEPGARIPTHQHSGTEECLVVEGDVYTDEISLGPGDYHCAPAGSTHETLSSVSGALLLIVAQATPDVLAAAM
jgi:anti-sigma factor ChrR (cupin superfamily)